MANLAKGRAIRDANRELRKARKAQDQGPGPGKTGAATAGPGKTGAAGTGKTGAGRGKTGATTAGYDVRGTLLAIAADPEANATARTSAARALAEMDGLLGRHQAAPDRASDQVLATLSRTELARELARLRRLCAGDKALSRP